MPSTAIPSAIFSNMSTAPGMEDCSSRARRWTDSVSSSSRHGGA